VLAYHCKLLFAAESKEIATFNIWELTIHLLSGWLPQVSECLPGALI